MTNIQIWDEPACIHHQTFVTNARERWAIIFQWHGERAIAVVRKDYVGWFTLIGGVLS